jgi:hypothetical protein
MARQANRLSIGTKVPPLGTSTTHAHGNSPQNDLFFNVSATWFVIQSLGGDLCMHSNRRFPVRRSSAFLPIAVITAVTILCVSCFIIWPAYAKLNKSRICAQEVSALKAIQIVHVAQVQYRSQYDRYAKTLAELGPSAADLIAADLASGDKQGYRFTMMGTSTGYTISAVPKSFGSTGARTFYSDQNLFVRQNYGQEPATVKSKEVGSARGQVKRRHQGFRNLPVTHCTVRADGRWVVTVDRFFEGVLPAHRGAADAAGTDWKSAVYRTVQEEMKADRGLPIARMVELGGVSRASSRIVLMLTEFSGAVEVPLGFLDQTCPGILPVPWFLPRSCAARSPHRPYPV